MCPRKDCLFGRRARAHVKNSGWKSSLLTYQNASNKTIAHVRYIKILTWLWGFLAIFLNLVWFSFLCAQVAFRNFETMETAILTLKPRSHVRILIYRTWAVRKNIYYYSTSLNRVQITQKTIRFLANVWMTHRKKNDLLSKPVWQVFTSDQLVTALLKAHENWTQVSLSHILVINRQACKFILSSILYSLR